MELISVIVPVYKVEPYLDRCVQSIVEQTYPNLEIILVDDGSPDNCPAMCDAWAEKDNRIRVIHKKNGGLSDARNAGLAVCRGTYIGFVDSDDWIHGEYLSLLYNACKVSDVYISACDVRVVGDEPVSSEILHQECCMHSVEEALGTLIKGTRFRAVAWNKLYHRSVLAGELFPVGRYHEDEFFTYRILAKTDWLAFVDAPLYYYYQRAGSIMNTASVRHLDVLDAWTGRLQFLKDNFPALYPGDKAAFCAACVHLYKNAQTIDRDDRTTYKLRIKSCRAEISFTMRELLQCSPKKLIYILGSRWGIGCLAKLVDNESE